MDLSARRDTAAGVAPTLAVDGDDVVDSVDAVDSTLSTASIRRHRSVDSIDSVDAVVSLSRHHQSAGGDTAAGVAPTLAVAGDGAEARWSRHRCRPWCRHRPRLRQGSVRGIDLSILSIDRYH